MCIFSIQLYCLKCSFKLANISRSCDYVLGTINPWTSSAMLRQPRERTLLIVLYAHWRPTCTGVKIAIDRTLTQLTRTQPLNQAFTRSLNPNPIIISHSAMQTDSKQELSYHQQIAHQLRTQYVEGIYRLKYYTVTLKSRLRVTQGHWKRNDWIDHTRLSSGRVIWRWILFWPWHVG